MTEQTTREDGPPRKEAADQEPIGQILLRRTSLTEEQLAEALRTQESQQKFQRLGRLLVNQSVVAPEEVQRAFAEQWDMPYVEDIPRERLSRELVRDIPIEFLLKHTLLPYLGEDGEVRVAMEDPLDTKAFDAVANMLERPCRRVVSPSNAIEEALSHCYYQEGDSSAEMLAELEEDEELASTAVSFQTEDLLDLAQRAPIIKLVNTILFQAVRSRASDVHIEPYEDALKVRFRIDGVLHNRFSPPKRYAAALISRLKIMADIDIAERRLPQDGRSRIKIGEKEIDLRVSTIPTSGGERVVMRLLDKSTDRLSLGDLGLASENEEQFRRLIHMSHGIVLLTGPTGSGKTTTLYAGLREINTEERNILTVEDPIEYRLPGIGQMQVQPKIDLTFANSLRHILRQDPDVIMVGEIRDLETAEIAIRAALTGHLVFSTLHTNDSASAVTRLLDMGIEPYLVSSSVVAIIAQRLVRKICPECKTAYSRTEGALRSLGIEQVSPERDLYRGEGCSACFQTGYYDRTGVFEMFLVDDEVRELVMEGAGANVVKQLAVSKGMRTLRDDGARKALSGVTTVEEVLRVTQEDTAQYEV